jgi:uncharacterized damage-inducible protein DinB
MEPWMTGTLTDLHPVQAALLYSLQHARQDIARWTADLPDDSLWLRTGDVAPAAFHIRHIGGSVDRLLTYATGGQLSEAQMQELQAEQRPDALMSREELFEYFRSKLDTAERTVRELDISDLNAVREIGRKRVPVPLGVLLVHIAEHTQRHVGEAIITLKVAREKLSGGAHRSSDALRSS